MMENMLNWASSQMQGFTPVITKVDLLGIVLTVLEGIQPSLEKKSLLLINQIPEGVTISADKNMVELILRNLLNNAVKFTPKNGTIELFVKEAQAGKELDEFLWSVVLPTGVRLWTELSAGGHIKKIQTNQIFVTPDTRNKIKLSDLNELLGKLEEGGEAAKKLADLDESKGMNRKKRPQVLAAEKILNEGANDEVAELRAQTKQLTETLDALMLEVRNLRRNSGQQVQEPVIKVVETAVESKKRGRKPSSSKE